MVEVAEFIFFVMAYGNVEIPLLHPVERVDQLVDGFLNHPVDRQGEDSSSPQHKQQKYDNPESVYAEHGEVLVEIDVADQT